MFRLSIWYKAARRGFRGFQPPASQAFKPIMEYTGKYTAMKRRLPAEWEDQDGVLIAWPHGEGDWKPYLHQVEPVFAEMALQISRYERVLVAASDPVAVQMELMKIRAEMDNITFVKCETNDTWTRDYGPITVFDNGRPVLLDFGFNGWGLKFASERDNLVTRRLHASGVFGTTPLLTHGFILEGGSIESDGQGTILTTSECLLGPNRNPHLNKKQIEDSLAVHFGADHFLWLNHGYLAGDDTDSHVDTLARLCPWDTILHVGCDDPHDEHFESIRAMTEELRSFRTRHGGRYRLVPLPWPSPKYDQDGQRLPATYANFLIINEAVLVPTYRDKSDEAALEIIRGVFQERTVIGVDCSPLILQHGSMHCVTMQIPKGVLA